MNTESSITKHDSARMLEEPSLNQHLSNEIADARLLLDFMLSERSMSAPSDRPDVKIDETIITAINAAEDALLQPERVLGKIRTQFESAYQDLVRLASPVTAVSLKATSRDFGRHVCCSRYKKLSEGEIWSRNLWWLTLMLIALAMIGEMFDTFANQMLPPIDSEERPGLWLYFAGAFLEQLTPFTYGGIGACAYLLRSAHQYIYRREFDPARISEYYNRILLGAVSGGAAVLFIAQIQTENGETIKLGASALGFLAGYNTEFLFRALERIIEAILPRVELTSIRRSKAKVIEEVPIEKISLKDLIEGLQRSESEEDRQVFRDLIAKFKSRL